MFSTALVLALASMPTARATDVMVTLEANFYAYDPSTGVVFDGFPPATFSLYDAPTGGTQVWTGNYTVIATEGEVSVNLGAGSTPLTRSLLLGDASVVDRWLEIEVSGAVLPTRIAVDTGDPDCSSDWAYALWFNDGDNDGWGDPVASVLACAGQQPTGTAHAGDCDDGDPAIAPGADEYCDAVDHDCNGQAEVDAVDATEFWTDTDADGFGDPEQSVFRCAIEAGLADNDGDCDDADAAVNPDADEICGPGDLDCDGDDDAGAVDAPEWFADEDGDGYGDATAALAECSAPEGYVDNADDCDDADASISPDGAELADDDGVDHDCDGAAEEVGGGGCDTGGAPVGWLALLGMLGLVRRR